LNLGAGSGERLFKLLKIPRANGLFRGHFLPSGDRKLAELSLWTPGIGYPLYDFTSSGSETSFTKRLAQVGGEPPFRRGDDGTPAPTRLAHHQMDAAEPYVRLYKSADEGGRPSTIQQRFC